MTALVPFVVLMVGAGYLLRKLGLVREEAGRDLNQVVFFVTLPPLIFTALHEGELTWAMLAMPAVAWGHTLVGLGLGWLLARALRLDPLRAGAVMVALAFGNTTFLGYPVIDGLYGRHHLTLAIFYDLLGATLATNSLGVLTAASFGQGTFQPRAVLRRLAVFPPIWALILGLAFRGVALPEIALELLRRIGDVTVPVIMLSIGMTLRFRAWREDLGLVGLLAVGRLVVLPLIVWGAVRLAGLPEDYQQAAVMQAAMPTMFFSLTLALVFGLRVNLVVNTIMVTTVASFATLPLWQRLLGP